MAWHVVILGGGFGGFHAARELEKRLAPHSARVTLIADQNFMLYTPLLPGAAAGTLEPRHVVVPLREELQRTDLRLGSVTGADPERKVVHVAMHDGRDVEVTYDQLIVSVGSISRTLPIPGLAEHAVGMKSLPEAIALRNRLVRCLEVAEGIEDRAERRAYLTFVFVGAGYAGLEGLAELQDFAADMLDYYPRCSTDGVRFVLVEARDRVMPEIGRSLAGFATRELRARGIEIRTGTTLDAVAEDHAVLAGDERIPTRTVVWTAGVKPGPLVPRLGLPLERSGRIDTERTLAVKGRPGVWAIGDAASVPDPARKGEACPPTAQHAIRQGRLVARNVAAALADAPPRPFRYRTLGVFVDLGRGKAVAQAGPFRFRGALAWFMARTYHLANVPGTKRRLRLLVDWNVGLVFGRDGSELGRLGHPEALGDGAEPTSRHDRTSLPAASGADDSVAGGRPSDVDGEARAPRPRPLQPRS